MSVREEFSKEMSDCSWKEEILPVRFSITMRLGSGVQPVVARIKSVKKVVLEDSFLMIVKFIDGETHVAPYENEEVLNYVYDRLTNLLDPLTDADMQAWLDKREASNSEKGEVK